MNVNDLYGTLYSPGDGTLDPAGWASALSRGATNKGAKVGGHFDTNTEKNEKKIK